MKKNFGAKAWLYPMPVLIIGSYDEEGRANAMNAAWGGISLEDRISICVDDAHKTTANLNLSDSGVRFALLDATSNERGAA